jgi:hypothetical protein
MTTNFQSLFNLQESLQYYSTNFEQKKKSKKLLKAYRGQYVKIKN